MLISLFLAKFLGLYMLVMGTVLIYRRKQWEKITRDFFDNQALILLSGVFALMFGLGIVLLHNIWNWNWEIVITVIGWLALVQAFFRLFMPEATKSFAIKMTSSMAYLIMTLIMIVVGLFLTYHGFIGSGFFP